MYYVRLKPPASAVRLGPHLTKVPWGVPSADFYFHDIGVQNGNDPSLHYTLNVPFHAAADLVASGCTIFEINQIVDGKHVPFGHTDLSKIDVRDAISIALDVEIQRYLMAHDVFNHHEVKPMINQRQSNGKTALVQNPHYVPPGTLRARALAIHDAKVAAAAAPVVSAT